MKTVLFCIPLKENHLEQYKDFVENTFANKAQEWKDMLTRYDMHNVKIYTKNIKGTDYVFVAHKVGKDFAEKIQGWNDSSHEFDQWFNQQLVSLCAAGATETAAVNLLDMQV